MMDNNSRAAQLTAQIVSAYVAANTVNHTALPTLIRTIRQSLTALDAPSDRTEEEPHPSARTATDIRKSVFSDHMVCLSCGEQMKMLKRHLRATHGMTPDQYRDKWGLPSNYPMITPNYTKTRSKLAIASGLGRKR